MPERNWFALVESNTTGSGREFCRAARTLGLRPVVLAEDPGRYPYVAADAIDTIVCDTSNVTAVLDACRALADGGLSGVYTSSDYFVAVAAEVATTLGLPAGDAAALRRCRHKDHQRTVLTAAGVPVPGFRIATSGVHARQAATELGLPVVVKPTAGSGSSGVRLCHTSDEAASWAEQLLAVAVNERGLPLPRLVLVEKFADGAEFSVESFDGDPVAVVGKHLGPGPYFVETGHDVPANAAPAQLEAVREVARAAVTALGVAWGPSHTEIRWTPRGPVVIEVNPRLAGGMIPLLVALTSGTDLIARTVARAAGRAPAPSESGQGGAAIRFLLNGADGTVCELSGLEEARRSPGVRLVEIGARPGQQLAVTHSFRDRVGYVIADGDDGPAAARNAQAALSHLCLGVR